MNLRMRFTFDSRGLKARIGNLVKKEAVGFAQKVVNKLIQDSPVFTGNFRASWVVTEGAPIYYAASGGSEESPLPAPRIRVTASSHFPALYITNGQPYAKRLEEGWSKKAPQGLVRVTVASLRGGR